jgi:hypothetical protein
MKLHQLSLFLENKPHHIRMAAKLLGDAGIDILTLTLADTKEFGIVRLIVDDWQKAKSVLEAAGCAVNVTEVAAIEVPDVPGGLAQVLGSMDKADLNIEYMYSCTFQKDNKAVLVFRFEQELDKVAAALTSVQVRFVTDEDLRNRGSAKNDRST